ncbi:MAG: hypothetical protein ACOCWH_05115 [Spirochaetota bacterium]
MNTVDIFFIFDNNDAVSVAGRLSELGLTVFEHSFKDIPHLELDPDKLSIVIIDCQDQTVDNIITTLRTRKNLADAIIYVVLAPSLIGHALGLVGNLMHTEFIEKPYNNREFILLIEKTIVVEKYREIMKQLSSEYEERIEKYEHLFQANRNNLFDSVKNGETFERILNFEKNLIERQKELNERINEFSCFRQRELMETRDILFANAMLDKLRERELREAKDTINAQERVIEFSSTKLDEERKINEAQKHLIDYSTGELDGQRRITEAQEHVVELSRDEAIRLHHRINALHEEKKELVEENQRLKRELQKAKGE